ncbi:hypothetical protein [Mycobacterium sp. 94-17]|uniref:hypothetical protein n=1 Tax=Mycobacterium sp. 94-17 TaxID=2986147 RepID=UPI002D1F6BAE|nr:hypothetical protein [Mycobacterium sp. 94-17]MEB4211737.1 hypothetical protein [Mycobacterium sp. 94-17]
MLARPQTAPIQSSLASILSGYSAAPATDCPTEAAGIGDAEVTADALSMAVFQAMTTTHG